MNEPALLFEKIEDAEIDAQLNKLSEQKKLNEAKNAKAEPQKPNVTYDEFSKMDIRIGTIMEAVKVPKTTKLMQLKVDTGLDTRTIVSGIAEYFTPEDLIGKQVTVLVNLEPRAIKGIQSQGMLLLAEDKLGKLILAGPGQSTDNGSVVR
jgi:methionyl-tRNA synthetase